MSRLGRITDEAEQLLQTEACDAWFEYGESCRQARTGGTLRYDEVEPWAWNRLQTRLRANAARRARLQRAHKQVGAAA